MHPEYQIIRQLMFYIGHDYRNEGLDAIISYFWEYRMHVMLGIRFHLSGLILLLAWFFPVASKGQWNDDFSDSDIIQGTAWEGDGTDFIVNAALELQLMAPAAGYSQLYTYQDIPDSARWEFYIRLDFSPSGTNQVGLILFADTADLSIANGYYLEIGETGSADAVDFYRLDNGQKSLLASGNAGAMGGTTAVVRGRMERDVMGNWSFFADYTGGFDLQLDFTSTDNGHLPGPNVVFGPTCLYTSTRTDKFFFDDFAIHPLLPDVTPPFLIQAELIDSQEIKLLFSEPVQESSTENPDSYLLLPENSQPSLVLWDVASPAEVRLTWSTTFQSFVSHTIQAFGITDGEGNIADTLAASFIFIPSRAPLAGELLINEFLPDPNPPAGLPDAEFIELYNASSSVLDLTGITIATSSSSAILPGGLLYPDSFLVLCRPEHEALFLPYGKTLSIPSLPVLPNDGTQLQLKNAQGLLLQDINYTSGWHATTAKGEGGWSLELVAPGQQCQRSGNWKSSEDPSGGTPSGINSVFEIQTDTLGPRLQRIWPESADRLILTFDELLFPDAVPAWISILPELPINGIRVLESGYELEVELGSPLLAGAVYAVKPTSSLHDCLGNPYSLNQSFQLGLPEIPAAGDLLINEVLFNPPTGGSDFIELYNVSDKIISLQQLLLGNIIPGMEESRPIHIEALSFPGDYVVLTSDTTFIASRWSQVDPDLLFQMTMPSFLNESGNVSLFYFEGQDRILLDQMNYHEDMHNALLQDFNGVSLERLSPDVSAGIADNWQSASQDALFATPTRKNSQFSSIPDGEGPFTLLDKIFSPDGDGMQDQLVIKYQFPEPGTILNLKIFDRQGRAIRDLANTQYLGREGILTWDGDMDNGQIAWVGAYILWFETFNLEGDVKQFKKAIYLAQKLN